MLILYFMEKRKIIQYGNSSFVLTMPRDWLLKNNIKKGEEMFLYPEENKILITNEKLENKIKTIELNIDDLNLKIFKKELISFYLRNFKQIDIVSKNNLYNILENFKPFIQNLPSLEISKIEENRIILKDYTDLFSLNLNLLIVEIIDLIGIIFYEIKNSKPSNLISSLDINVNKCSYLINKSIYFIIENSQNTNLIKKLFLYKKMNFSFEKIGDILKRISRYLSNSNQKDNKEILQLIIHTTTYFELITSFLNLDKLSNNNLNLYVDKKNSLLKDIDFKKQNIKENIRDIFIIGQLLKDIIGELDLILEAIFDLNY